MVYNLSDDRIFSHSHNNSCKVTGFWIRQKQIQTNLKSVL